MKTVGLVCTVDAQASEPKDPGAMTVAQLKVFAAERGIAFEKSAKKEDILAAIAAAENPPQEVPSED